MNFAKEYLNKKEKTFKRIHTTGLILNTIMVVLFLYLLFSGIFFSDVKEVIVNYYSKDASLLPPLERLEFHTSSSIQFYEGICIGLLKCFSFLILAYMVSFISRWSKSVMSCIKTELYNIDKEEYICENIDVNTKSMIKIVAQSEFEFDKTMFSFISFGFIYIVLSYIRIKSL